MLAERVSAFLRHTGGATVRHYALVSMAMAVTFVTAANMVASASKRGLLPEIVWHTARAPTVVESGAIDYTPTGSIPSVAAATRLDPCTGKSR